MKRKLVGLAAVATASALVLAGCSAGGGASAPSTDGKGKTVTLWLVGADTPDPLRTYLKTEFKKETGATLNIQQQDWGDIVTKLTTSLPDANNTPDVTEMGNTQSPTFTNVGAFLDISDMYKELGGSDLLQSFVDAGKVDGKNYTLPYYFGSRYTFYRKDVWSRCRRHRTRPRSTSSTPDVATITAEEPEGHQGLLGLLPRRPGLAQRHLVDLRQRWRHREEEGRQVGRHARVRGVAEGSPAAAGPVQERIQGAERRQGLQPVHLPERQRPSTDADDSKTADTSLVGRHHHGSGLGALVDR